MRAIELDLDGIAFTEHYSYEVSEPVEELKEKFKGKIRIFRGVELTSPEGHCLVFGANTDALPVRHSPVQELITVVNRSGGVVIPSHPYRAGSGLGDAITRLRGICALEGYNGCNMHPYNAKAIEAAETLRLPFTGGSDAHAPQEVGLCYTEFSEEVRDDNLVDLLIRGAYRGVDARRKAGRNTLRPFFPS